MQAGEAVQLVHVPTQNFSACLQRLAHQHGFRVNSDLLYLGWDLGADLEKPSAPPAPDTTSRQHVQRADEDVGTLLRRISKVCLGIGLAFIVLQVGTGKMHERTIEQRENARKVAGRRFWRTLPHW